MRPEARVGVVFNEWRLDALVSAGPVAATYAATRFGERASIEILHPHLAAETALQERFLRLADVTRRVDHPGVVRIITADTTRGGDVFLMKEPLSGETLEAAWRGHERHRLSGGARSPASPQPTMRVERALPIFRRLLDCLAAVHDQRLLHRMLEPSSVFLEENDRIKLLELGIAEIRDAIPAGAAASVRFGTPAYLAPEQAMGLAEQLDGRADVFAVGAMMHALLTGHEINDAGTAEMSLVMAATRPVRSVSLVAPHLPGAVAEIIDKALQWDRRLRYSNAREMQEAIVVAISKTRPSQVDVVIPAEGT